MTRRGGSLLLLLSGIALCGAAWSGIARAQRRQAPGIVGRWDLMVRHARGEAPAWLEVAPSGFRTLVGRYVGFGGSARPIGKVEQRGGKFHFALPPQWEPGSRDLRFEGAVHGDTIEGEMQDGQGKRFRWTGARAPALAWKGEPRWGQTIALFNGRDMEGWQAREGEKSHGWKVIGGILSNARPGTDIQTARKFRDFRLRAEFRYPKGSNSGIYLRGRYEAQIEDNYGQQPNAHGIGGIYGFLPPYVNAAKPAGEWQTMEIILTGRVVSITLNGQPVIARQTIPGITGGALDSREGEPGPILLQGDHGPIEFRALTLTPAMP